MPALEGGAALPVTTSGTGATEARAAVPVYVVSGGPVIGQRARRVVVVTSGPVEGGAAIPVYDTGANVATDGDAALPVYIVSGPNLYPLAYTSKVDALNPIAYWPLAEPSGTTIVDESGNGRNGAYTAVTLGQAGIGDGRTSASFNGTTSYGNIHGASFAGAFNPAEGTAALWLKVSGAGVWTDGTTRRALSLRADASNLIQIQRPATNNLLQVLYNAGGTLEAPTIATSSLNWLHIAVTWSKSADQVKIYLNGAQSGATQTGLGIWVGALDSTLTNIGATAQPSTVWSGLLAHVAVWNTPLSAAQIATLAVGS